MKSKFILLSLTLLTLAACEQTPDTDRLDDDYLVYTNYDKGIDISNLNTFYAIDSILLISEENKPTYWNNTSSSQIIEEFSQNLIAYGYEKVDFPEEADVILQLSYVSSTYYYYNYDYGNPWWNSYPGYWSWNSYGWYYPFFVPYSFSTGSIIGEIVDLKNRNADTEKLTVIWNTYICGLLSGNSLSMSRTLDGIKQAFSQSTYLSK